MVGNLIFEMMKLITSIERKEVKMKKRKLSKKSPPKPTPRGLPTMKEFREVMQGVDLWEMDKPPEVVARGRKIRRPWLT